MAAVDLARRWTREEVLALPDDGNRYELVDGELLVTPSPAWRHQRALRGLFRSVDHYVERHRLGETLWSPADLELGRGEIFQPDLFVLAEVRAPADRDWKNAGVPLLVVEVLSPSHPENDREKKRRRYQEVGVPTYWIVDLDVRAVEVWTPTAKRAVVVSDTLTWRPEPSLPAMELDLAGFFAGVLDV